MLSQADPRRNASLGVAAATYDPARPVAVGRPATAFLPSLVLTAFLSDANAIYTTVAIACSQTLAELTPFGLVLACRVDRRIRHAQEVITRRRSPQVRVGLASDHPQECHRLPELIRSLFGRSFDQESSRFDHRAV